MYCGSNDGARPIYADVAIALADELVARDIELVYGGTVMGVMGVLAKRVLEAGGKVHGVIPAALAERALEHIGEIWIHNVDTMHERKALMAELSDGFIALPGGIGTLEELVEILTWGQLRIHDKPCGVLNIDGYFDHLQVFLDHMVSEGFLRPENRRMLLTDNDPATLIRKFEWYKAPAVEKWIS